MVLPNMVYTNMSTYMMFLNVYIWCSYIRKGMSMGEVTNRRFLVFNVDGMLLHLSISQGSNLQCHFVPRN